MGRVIKFVDVTLEKAEKKLKLLVDHSLKELTKEQAMIFFKSKRPANEILVLYLDKTKYVTIAIIPSIHSLRRMINLHIPMRSFIIDRTVMKDQLHLSADQ